MHFIAPCFTPFNNLISTLDASALTAPEEKSIKMHFNFNAPRPKQARTDKIFNQP